MPERLTFDHYCVCQREDGSRLELGRGAAGVTYKAMDVNLDCPVALKVLDADLFQDDDSRAGFIKEARAAAQLRHRHIASVYHLGNDGEHFFYAMEFVDGETAEALVKREGPLSPEKALRIALQVARALAAANRQGIVHRDIKPANLLIASDPTHATDGLLVKVIDFGMACSLHGGATQDGFCGTPQYASPEQAEERELDGRSDIYSLGCTLWFLLTGHAPFTGSLANILVQRLRTDPPWEELEAFPPVLRKLLRIMLRRNPAERPRDGIEVQRAIEMCLATIERRRNVQLRWAASLAGARRWFARRSRVQAAALAGFVALALISGFGAWAKYREQAVPDTVAVADETEPAVDKASPMPAKTEPTPEPLQRVVMRDAEWLAANPTPANPASAEQSPELALTPQIEPAPAPVASSDANEEEPAGVVPQTPKKRPVAAASSSTRRSSRWREDEGFKASVGRAERKVRGFFRRIF